MNPRLLAGLSQDNLIMRAVPSSGEQLPLVGLGSSATFSSVARSDDATALGEVLKALVENGGKVFDTAPSYGASEQVAGELAAEHGISNRIFWATKVNAVGRGSSAADPAAVNAQLERTFERLRVPTIDLIQVHNLGDPPTQLGILQGLKEAGRIRYIGVTSTSERRYPDLAEVMRTYPLDFIGVDYAVDNRGAADMIFPLAQERGIGVLVYVPFGRTRLWNRIEGVDLPEWAAEFDATTWAQFFIKFAGAHPAVTTVTPATSQPRHMIDNMGGARGRLPDAAMQARMATFVDALPSR
jgi:aryl-alcohol dehydrogenase-like predicted oxidoreductase